MITLRPDPVQKPGAPTGTTTLDEVLIDGAHVHMEMMDDHILWIGVDLPGVGTKSLHVTATTPGGRKGRLLFTAEDGDVATYREPE